MQQFRSTLSRLRLGKMTQNIVYSWFLILAFITKTFVFFILALMLFFNQIYLSLHLDKYPWETYLRMINLAMRHLLYSTRNPKPQTTGANRPLALRGHWPMLPLNNELESVLMPKIDGAHKNYLSPKLWKKTHLREIFYGTLIFQQSSIVCIGRHVWGHTLALPHGGQNYFLLISC